MFFQLFFRLSAHFRPHSCAIFHPNTHIIFCCPLSAYDKWWFEQKNHHILGKSIVLSYLEAILVIFGRSFLNFLFERSLRIWNITSLLCECAVVITLETQKCRKRHLASSNLTFLPIALDENVFRRVKEEGQIYKNHLRIFNFCLGTKLWSFKVLW